MKDLADVAGRLKRFQTDIRRRTVLGIALLFALIAYFGGIAFRPPGFVQRVGACLTIVALLYMEWQLYARRLRETSPAAGSPSLIDGFRVELVRQRDFHRGIWFWSRLATLVPAYLLFVAGLAISRPKTAHITHLLEICTIALAIAAVPLNLRLARKYQRQIDELDVLRGKLS